MQRFAKTQTDLDFAKLACALERYRRANGAYPENLDALVPQFVDKLPHDIVSGGPLSYRQSAEEGFVLHAVGLDGTDNQPHGEKSGAGGWVWKPAPKTDAVSAYR